MALNPVRATFSCEHDDQDALAHFSKTPIGETLYLWRHCTVRVNQTNSTVLFLPPGFSIKVGMCHTIRHIGATRKLRHLGMVMSSITLPRYLPR